MSQRIPIIGIDQTGLEGLSAVARSRIENADLLVGKEHVLRLVTATAAEKLFIGADLAAIADRLERDRKTKKIVVLATGDPLFYGTTRFFGDRLGKEQFEVIPHVSMMQLAFARIMESWDEAYLTNAGAHRLEDVVDRIRTCERAGLFTSPECPPAAIAKALLSERIDYFQGYVCENLGAPNEVVTQGTLAELAEMEFGPLNVFILIRLPDVPDRARDAVGLHVLGNPDECFRQSRPKRGLLTPAEVRTLGLAQLNIKPTSIIWDVGAGSGAVAIEAAQLARDGRAYAIEPDQEDCLLIRENAARFKVANVEVVMGRAPDALDHLPAPDAIFMGATGRDSIGILSLAYERLKPGGSLVTNVATLEGVSQAVAVLRTSSLHVGALMVNLARGVPQLETIRFEAVNPSFLVFVTKPAELAFSI